MCGVGTTMRKGSSEVMCLGRSLIVKKKPTENTRKREGTTPVSVPLSFSLVGTCVEHE